MVDAALRAALAQTREALGQARTLPGCTFTEQTIFARELRSLFARHWLAIAREQDLPEPGCYITHELGSERILVVRGEDARLRAFYNVCRHRGARLIDDACGRLRGAIGCPYHAWSYGLDGRFKRAPRMAISGGEAAALGLTELALATHLGFVFVNLDPAAGAFNTEALPDLARFELGSLRRVRRLDYEIEANWKIVCENYGECYHCALVHPQLNRLADISAGGFEQSPRYNGGPMALRDGVETLSMSGRGHSPHLCPSDPTSARYAYYYLLYPNLMLGIHPDYLVAHQVWPLAAARSRIRCELYFVRAACDSPGFDPSATIEFWDLTNRQDWVLCERVQQGSASSGYRPGPYHESERCVHAFDRWYAEWLLQETAAHRI